MVVIVLDIRPLEEVLLVDKVNVVVGVKLVEVQILALATVSAGHSASLTPTAILQKIVYQII